MYSSARSALPATPPAPRLRGAGVRAKLVGAVVAACLLVLGLTGAVLRILCSNIEQSAQLEARNLAASVALGATFAPDLQRYVGHLDGLYRRDLFIVDRDRRTVADILPADVGKVYREDGGGEVEQTMVDGRPRRFVEASVQHPRGIEQLVVPLRRAAAPDSPIVGAVVLEYTGIERQLFHASAWALYSIGAGGLLAALAIGGFGYRITSRLARGIRAVHQGVQVCAAGAARVRVEPLEDDEVGALTSAFNRMAGEIERGRRELLLETGLAKEAARHAEFLAYTDPLTGLPNRARFARLMAEALLRAEPGGSNFGVLFIDLDRFKNVNDTLGHAAGDSLLWEIANRLQSCAIAHKRIARFGGDEFVVLVPEVETAAALGAVARKLLTAIAQPMLIGDQELRVTASVGIAVYPRDGRDEHTLMKHADIALYRAKDDGRDGYAFYSPQFNRHSVERLAFESELRRAVEQRQLRVHYQPKVEAGSGRVVGVEALARWDHPTMGAVAPSRFIPVAEASGLIAPLGRWVLEQACRQQAAWRAQGLAPGVMSVNLSPRQFADPDLVDDVRAIVTASGIAAAELELEITESLLMQGDGACAAQIHALKRLGLRLAVDDFGTGYSSLASLRQFPVDTLKIDRAFVRGLEEGAEDRAITRAIVAMGHSLGLKVVAEGVETDGQYAILCEQGCDEIQGHYFGRALEPAALTGLLEAQPRAPAARAAGAAAAAAAGAARVAALP